MSDATDDDFAPQARDVHWGDGLDNVQQEQLPDRPDFITELQQLINRYSIENNSNTPDFILAKYLTMCLGAWNQAVTHRDKWYGFKPMSHIEGNDLLTTDSDTTSEASNAPK
jgi:hypothetical protein